MSHRESLAGKLLVANPLMGDPNFARAVILILEDNETDGTMGLVLSRPTEELVAGYLPMWADTVAPPDVIFIGGPVMTDVAIGLGAGPAAPPEEWKAVVGDVGLVDVAYAPDHWGGLSTARIFAGYSGWIPGQLDAELAIESWVVCDAAPGDATDAHPETLWQRVLARQPGSTAWLATFPQDLSTN
jgi:putative transcriptional regulator